MARNRSRRYSALQQAADGVGHRFAFQKALDPLAQGGVHGRYWSGVGAHKACRNGCERFGRGSGIGLYVLADTKAQVRLVSRARLRSRLRLRARPINGSDWRASDRVPMKVWERLRSNYDALSTTFKYA